MAGRDAHRLLQALSQRALDGLNPAKGDEP
jgi:hypothetical protein